jgi:uncharacterized RDD family membrane protein YckC
MTDAAGAAPALARQPEAQSAPNLSTVVLADKGVRVAGYLIDVIPAAIMAAALGWIPIIGFMFAGFVLTAYWLLRDVTGTSLGKMVLGTKVMQADGQPASAGSRIVRNLPLIAGPICMMIPLLGYFVALPISFLVVLVEGILVLSQGSRIGDHLGRTIVVKTR